MSAQPHLIYQLVKQSTVDSSHQESLKTVIMQSFDIGELVQRVGDAMAGMASGLDVGLVIYHSDDSLHHVTMMGDEDAIQHMLISLLRNILEGCTPGACIELGLSVVSDAPKFKVTFDIIHTASPAIPVGLSATLLPNANFTTQLIQYIKCNMVVEDMGKNKTRFVIQLEADAGHKHTTKKPLGKPLTSIPCSHEPTLKELTHFIRQLKGVKLVLYAAKQSMFAKHLTSSLASWNTDISHIPTHVWDEDSQQLKQEEVSSQSSQSSMHTAQSSFSVGSQCSNAFFNSQRTSNQTQVPSPALEEDNIRAIPPAFILIDDDVATLKARLYELYTQPLPFSPTLQLHTQGRRKHKPQTPNSLHQKTTAIIFFTSLYNYKHVRDILRRLIPSYQTSVSIPRVVVVPKPAGPRRFLTALHTAWSNAMVEPQFMPIATSPSHLLTSPVLSGTNGSAVATSTPGPESVDNGEASLGISISAGTDINTTAGTNTPGGMMDLTNFNTIASSRVKTSPATGPEVFSSPFRDDSIATDLSSRHKANNGFYTSPSGLAAETIFEKGNYFFDPIRTPSAMTPGSPSNRHTHSQNSAFLSSNRHPLNDQTILPEFIAVQGSPYGQLSPGGSPFKQAIHAMENQGMPIVPIEDTVLDNGNAVLMSPDVSDSTRTVQAVQEKGKETTKKSMRFKISHRKKKEKDKSASGVSSPPINVLIVEDNMINQVILSTWMKRHSIKYEVASNGKEAVEKWQKGGFHLVLMDIQLPVMNGLEATKTIRSIEKEQRIGVLPSAPPSFHHQKSNDSASSDVLSLDVGEDTTPGHMQVLPLPPSPFRSPVIIVALTASSLESDRQAALAAGCNDFLTKPVSLEWLEKKIMEWGCMQALIDFEGWRKWKQTAQPTHLRKSSSAVAKEKTPEPTIQRIPQRQGILLPGVSSLVKRGDDRSSRPKRSSRKISSMS
ncbi:hypothetical protein BDF14DRAFT_1771841 [Spinellus fusiger]|nr:hypothetical protein BDF14DRAFT_1771841 [Spinellus fusiger]